MTAQQHKNWLVYEHRARIESAIPPSFFSLLHRRLMKTLHPATLPTLVSFGYNGNDHAIPEIIIYECIRNESFAYLNDLAAFLVDTKDDPVKSRHGKPFSKYDLITHFKGLRVGTTNKYGHKLRFDHYSKVSPRERAIQRAIIRAAIALLPKHVERQSDKYEIGITRLASDDLVRYLMNNPDRAEDAVAIINARHSVITEDSIKNVDDFINVRREITTPLLTGAL